MMRMGTLNQGHSDLEDLWTRVFGSEPSRPVWQVGRYDVPTDVFHSEGSLVIRMDLPEVDPDEVDISVQDNVLLINGTRRFPYESEDIRFIRRGTFYGEFTQRVALGKGLDVEKIGARYEGGVLEVRIPYAEEVKPRKVEIQRGTATKELE
jgi:HSP20 family protein